MFKNYYVGKIVEVTPEAEYTFDPETLRKNITVINYSKKIVGSSVFEHDLESNKYVDIHTGCPLSYSGDVVDLMRKDLLVEQLKPVSKYFKELDINAKIMLYENVKSWKKLKAYKAKKQKEMDAQKNKSRGQFKK